MKTFAVRTVKKAGIDPLTRKPSVEETETISIEATDRHDAYKKSFRQSKLRFMGQDREVYVDGTLEEGNH